MTQACSALSAGRTGINKDSISRLDGVHVGTNRSDHSGCITTGNAREGNARDLAAAPDVQVVDPGSMDIQEHLAWAGRIGLRDVIELQDRGGTLLVEANGSHSRECTSLAKEMLGGN